MNKIIVGILLFVFIFISISLGKIMLIIEIIFTLSLIEFIYVYIQNKKKIKKNKIICSNLSFIFGCFIIGLVNYIIKYKIFNSKIIIQTLLLSNLNDIAQMYWGKLYGKTKITKISPNKTLEGYIGGYITLLFTKIFTNFYNFKFMNLVYISNIIGDLFFSYIKRLIKIKDYSKILGSHGGINDRIDSFIFAINSIYFFY